MSAARVPRWPLVAAAVASVLLLIPQAQASHHPGFGHDNPLEAGVRTHSSCNVGVLSCLRVDTTSASAGFAITGNTAGTTSGGVLGSTTATTTAPGVEGQHTGGGTGPGVYGNTSSTSSSALGVLGEIVPTAPGSFSAAVRGKNNGTGGAGMGVWGSHAGFGWGGYFTAGANGTGVVATVGGGGDGINATSGAGSSLGYGVLASTGSPRPTRPPFAARSAAPP